MSGCTTHISGTGLDKPHGDQHYSLLKKALQWSIDSFTSIFICRLQNQPVEAQCLAETEKNMEVDLVLKRYEDMTSEGKAIIVEF